MKKEPDNIERKIALISRAVVFKGISESAQKDFADLAVSIRYPKKFFIFVAVWLSMMAVI